MVSTRPFVVSNISTKRYAPAKEPPSIPPPMSTQERSSVPRASRPGSLPTVVPKAAARRGIPKPTSIPAPSKTTKVQKVLPVPLPQVLSTGQSFPDKPFVPKPLKIVKRLQEGKLLGGCPPVGQRSTQAMITQNIPPRPTCVPRTRVYVGVVEASKGTQGIAVKVSTAGPRNTGISRKKPSVNVGIVKATDTSVVVPVPGGCRAGTLARNRRLTAPRPIAYPQAVHPMPGVAWSPSPSPVSSSPSQNWMVVVDVEVEQITTPATTVCGDDNLSSMDESGVADMPNGSCAASEAIPSPLSLSPSSTVIETSDSPAKSTAESDSVAIISSPTKAPSAEVSPTKISDAEDRAQTLVQSPIELARPFFSPPRHATQSSAETVALETTTTHVARIRRLFMPQLDEGAKASKNPMTQMEIEMLRAQKKVVGGGVVDPRLERLGSLIAMAIVATELGTSGSDGPSQV